MQLYRNNYIYINEALMIRIVGGKCMINIIWFLILEEVGARGRL